MSLESDVKLLGQIPLLSEFGEDRLRLIAFSADNRRLADGEALFYAGQPADGAYVVASGALDFFKTDRDHRIARRGAGALIDERALIVDSHRTLSAIARGSTEVIHIRRALFRRMLDEYPEVAVRLRPYFAAALARSSLEIRRVGERLGRLGDGE